MKFGVGTPVRNVSRWAAVGPHAALGAACLAALIAFMLLQPKMSADAALPAIAILFFLMACVAVLLAWLDRGASHAPHLTYWDVSGLLTFIGICIAAAVEPEALVRLVAAGNRAE